MRACKPVFSNICCSGLLNGTLSFCSNFSFYFYLAKHLSDLVNSSLKLSEMDTVAETMRENGPENSFFRTQANNLLGISGSMNQHLTDLLVDTYNIQIDPDN